MEAFLNDIMDENAIPDDLLDMDCYMYASEGNYGTLPTDTL
jgi:hypothetical protein